jgi:uncharacterized protein (TIGR02466 family)
MPSETPRWIETSDVISMFPTLVWKVVLAADARAPMDAQMLAAIAAMRRDAPPLGRFEAWQSETTLQERDEFEDLVARGGELARTILRFLRVGHDDVTVTGCWATVLARGAAHKAHTHPNNFLSAVYYLRTSPGADTINFHDPRNQTAVIRPPVFELTAANTDQVVVRVTDGTLLMFPAWLSHSVDASESDDERVSVSFNVMFKGFTEQLAKPLW